jgi:hypothetical protein
MLCFDPKYLFVAYIAVDNTNEQANNKAIPLLLKKMAKKYVKKHDIPFVFSEIKRTAEIQNNSLAKNFARHSKSLGKKAYLLDFDYILPKMPNGLNEATDEEIMSLLVIPNHEIEFPKIEKEFLLKVIKSIYYKIYYPSCNSLGGCERYEFYLDSLVKLYDSTDLYVTMITLNK